MSVSSNWLQRITKAVTFIVTLQVSYAMAADQCSQVFSDRVYFREISALNSIMEVRREYELLRDTVMAGFQPQGIDFQKQIDAIGLKAEKYLEKAKIQYKKETIHTDFLTLFGKSLGPANYPVYHLSDGSKVDKNSRLLLGIRLKNDSTLKIILDPLFLAKTQQVAGQYNFHDNAITIGHTALYDSYLIVNQTFRHEVHHYFEQLKINRGESSLARFSIKGPIDKEVPYSDFLRLDEVETHIRDLRGMKITSQKENILTGSAFKDAIPTIVNIRAAFKAEKLQRIKRFIEVARIAFNAIEEKKYLEYNAAGNKNGGMTLFYLFEGGKSIEIELSEIDFGKSIKEQIAEKLKVEINFAKSRMEKIETELTRL